MTQITIETQAAIEAFNTAVKHAIQSRAKNVRLDIVDASLLMSELSNVMSRLAILEHGVMGSSPHFDGGKF